MQRYIHLDPPSTSFAWHESHYFLGPPSLREKIGEVAAVWLVPRRIMKKWGVSIQKFFEATRNATGNATTGNATRRLGDRLICYALNNQLPHFESYMTMRPWNSLPLPVRSTLQFHSDWYHYISVCSILFVDIICNSAQRQYTCATELAQSTVIALSNLWWGIAHTCCVWSQWSRC